MNAHAEIGHNQPPTPMEICASEHDAAISEAQNWGDGVLVESEDQMKAVDQVIKGLKTYRTALNKAGKEYTQPAHEIWKGRVSEVKVYTDDADLLQKAMVALVAPFKAKLAAEKEAERQAAWEAARQAEREAAEIAARANAANIEQTREAEDAKAVAMEAKKLASAAQKDKVKGLRTVTRHEILSMRDLVNWIATNDKAAMAEFAMEYARKTHPEIPDAIVRTWTEKEAF